MGHTNEMTVRNRRSCQAGSLSKRRTSGPYCHLLSARCGALLIHIGTRQLNHSLVADCLIVGNAYRWRTTCNRHKFTNCFWLTDNIPNRQTFLPHMAPRALGRWQSGYPPLSTGLSGPAICSDLCSQLYWRLSAFEPVKLFHESHAWRSQRTNILCPPCLF